MTERSPEDAFVQRVRDAAEQLWLMRAWEYDQSLKDQGWATYYAVDADVFTTYGSVERQALRTKDRPGYSEVFFDDPPAGSYGLAERIVDHIFFHLQPGMPLLVIPPIDFEIRNILSAMTLRLGREPTPVTIDPEAIAAAIAEIRNLDRNERIPPDILTHFSKLLSVQENSARAEYLRLSNLLELRRVVPSHALEIEDGYPKIVADAINSENDVAELYEHILLSSEWIDRLSKKPGVRLAEYRQQKLIRDAYALARLEIWNRKLADQKARVIYVTGAPHILNAALSYKKENINFFSTSIRHPRYFLASPEVVVRSDTSSNSEGKSSSQFFEWIVTFLADCRLDPATSYKSVGDFQIDQEFEKAAKVAFRRDPNLGADIQAKWRDYLLSIAASYVPPEQVLELTKRELRQSQQISALDDWKKFREKIDSRIEEENDRAWDDCFRTATRAGFFVGYEAGARKGEPPSRLVPPLRFDRWPQTEDFVRFMSEWRDPKSDIVAQYEARLEKVREETKGDFLYAYYLAHAALFAARGDWRIGAILSVRAIGKASHPEPENETTGHGREACYLAAYCLRHRFKTISDLVEAESYLDRAIAIYHKEIAKKPSLVALPDRFEAEKLAFTMTRLLYRRYGQSEGREIGNPSSSEWNSIRTKYVDLSNKLLKKINKKYQIENETRINNLMCRLLSRIDSNILLISMLMDDLRSDMFVSSGRRLNQFLSNSNESRSYYLESIDLYWRAATMNGPPRRLEIRKRFNPHKIAMHAIFPYDRSRYKDIGDRSEALIRHKK